VFLYEFKAKTTRKLINDEYWLVDENKIYIYFHGLHNIWSQEYRKTRGEEAFKEGSIRAYLKEESGFLEINAIKRIKGQLKKCIVFDYATASIDLKSLIDVDYQPVSELARKDLS